MRIAPRTASLALLLVLAACKPTTPDTQAGPGAPAPVAPTPAAQPAAEPPAQPAPACPDVDFAAFLQRFEGSVDVQRASTADPLTMESIDPEAEPEPATVSRDVPLAEVEFPVVVDAAQRQAEGSQQTVTELGADAREVKIAIPDTDAQIRFEFRADPCWKLVKVSNDSL